MIAPMYLSTQLTARMTDDIFSSCASKGKGLILRGSSDLSDIRVLQILLINTSFSVVNQILKSRTDSLNTNFVNLQKSIGFVVVVMNIYSVTQKTCSLAILASLGVS